MKNKTSARLTLSPPVRQMIRASHDAYLAYSDVIVQDLDWIEGRSLTFCALEMTLAAEGLMAKLDDDERALVEQAKEAA